MALVIIALIVFDRDPPSVDLIPYETAIAIADLKIDSLTKGGAKLAAKIKSDSIKRDKQSKAYQQEVKIKSAAIAKLKANPRVVYIRESEPTIDSLIVAYDSIGELKDRRIDTLEVSLDELQINMKAVNVNCDQMLEAERDKFKASEELISDLEKQVKRSKRGNRRLTAGIVVSAVAGLFLGSGL